MTINHRGRECTESLLRVWELAVENRIAGNENQSKRLKQAVNRASKSIS